MFVQSCRRIPDGVTWLWEAFSDSFGKESDKRMTEGLAALGIQRDFSAFSAAGCE